MCGINPKSNILFSSFFISVEGKTNGEIGKLTNEIFSLRAIFERMSPKRKFFDARLLSSPVIL